MLKLFLGSDQLIERGVTRASARYISYCQAPQAHWGRQIPAGTGHKRPDEIPVQFRLDGALINSSDSMLLAMIIIFSHQWQTRQGWGLREYILPSARTGHDACVPKVYPLKIEPLDSCCTLLGNRK